MARKRGVKAVIEPLNELVDELKGAVKKSAKKNKEIHLSGEHRLNPDKKATTNSNALGQTESASVAGAGGNPQTKLVQHDTSKINDPNPAKNQNGQSTNKLDNQELSGDPISLITGEELLRLDDGTLPGILPFVWQRFYRTSAADLQQELGFGWSHSLSHKLTFVGETVEWQDSENRLVSFSVPTAKYTKIENPLSDALLCAGEDDHTFVIVQSGQKPALFFTRHGDVGRLTRIADNYHNDIAIQYDAEGLVHQVLSPALEPTRKLSFTYSADKLIVSAVLSAFENNEWQVLREIARYQYNDARQLVSCTNALDETEFYQYDQFNVIQSRQLAGGAQFNWQWEGEGKAARCIRQWGNFSQLDEKYQWDDENHRVTVTHQDGSQTICQHDDSAQLVKKITPDGIVTELTYNSNGQLIQEIDGLGGVTFFDYDSAGNLSSIEHPDGRIVNYDYVYGQIYKVIEGRGQYYQDWTYRRNPAGDLIEFIDPEERSTRYEYDERGKITSVTYPDGSQVHLRWSLQGELIEESSVNGGTKQYGYTRDSQLAWERDSQGNETHYQYDALGRLVKVTFADKTTRQYQYNAYGKVTHFTDEAGRQTRYEYDSPLHLLTKKILPDGQTLHYRYDNVHLQVSEIRNQKNERYLLGYNADGLLNEEIGFDNIKTTYHYDLKKQLIAKCEFGDEHDSTPLVTQYVRDPSGRLLKKILPDGVEENYQYDPLGRLTGVQDGENVLAWEYDKCNNLTAEHQNWATIRHRYDRQTGYLSGTKLPDGQWIEYHYREGQLRGITLDENPIAAFNYDNSGRERERRQGNGLVNRYHYDEVGRLSQHYLREGFEDSPQTLWKQDYQYQPDGELNKILGSNARHYGYDEVGRLTSAAYPETNHDHHHASQIETFQYDTAGNRIGGEGELAHYALGNRLAFFGDRHFEYDRFGNLIAERRGKEHKLLTTYEYDCRHRLIKHVSPNGRVSIYTYDAFNRRTSKTVDGKKTEFIWQGNKLIAECSDKDTVWRSYLYEPDSFRPLALVEGHARKAQKTRTYWYQNDHLGTPHSLTDSLGALVYSCTYNAYGQLQTETQHQQEERGIRIETNLRFQGQYWDEETGLHYNLNRYYDPRLGRYLTPDPIKLAGGLNQYSYVDDNPVGWVDPLGLFKQDATGFENIAVNSETGVPEVYTVGSYGDLRDAVKGKNTGMDAHHVGQKAVLGDLVEGYDLNTAPAILVTKEGHTRRKDGVGVVSRSKTNPKTGLPFDNPRDVIARDVRELRRVYDDVPNFKLQQLIKMNKDMYPEIKNKR